MKEETENLGLAAIDSVALDNIKDVSTTLMDSVLTSILDNTVLESIPWIGVLFKAEKIRLAIRDRLFIKKVGRFLFQLKDVPTAERQEFVENMNANPAYKQRVGENVLLLLDRADDMEKADIHGKLFRSFMTGIVTYDSYRRFAGIIDKAHVPDLSKLVAIANVSHIEEPELSEIEQTALYTLGLTSQPMIRAAAEIVSTELSDLGVELRKLLSNSI